MAFDTQSRFGLWTENVLSSAVQRVQGLLSGRKFTPEEALAEAKNIDPRLVPKVSMQSADIDTNLLLELSKLGMKHGKLVSAESHPELMQSWKVMSARAGLKRPPQLIIVESKVINAMTVSPEEVVVTTGLLKKLDLREVNAVLGHELGHAVSDHKRPRIVANAIFGGLGGIAAHRVLEQVERKPVRGLSGLVTEAFAYLIGISAGGAVANQISVKPTEFQADLKGAAISGDPLGLVSALHKLESSRARNPLMTTLSYLRSGYPTTAQRIHNLETIAAQVPGKSIPAALTVQPAAPQIAVSQPSPQVTSIAADARLESAATAQFSLN